MTPPGLSTDCRGKESTTPLLSHGTSELLSVASCCFLSHSPHRHTFHADRGGTEGCPPHTLTGTTKTASKQNLKGILHANEALIWMFNLFLWTSETCSCLEQKPSQKENGIELCGIKKDNRPALRIFLSLHSGMATLLIADCPLSDVKLPGAGS